jgi:hypothetical protein
MAITTSTVAYVLKTVYTPRAMQSAVYKNNPLFAMMPKEGGFTGATHVHAVRYRDSLARSPIFSVAQYRAGANGATAASGYADLAAAAGTVGNTLGKQFIINRNKEYAIYTLEQEAILAGRDDKGSLVRILSTEVDAALNNLNRTMGHNMYETGSGALGVSTNVASTTITVGEAIVNFELGMTLWSGTTEIAAVRGAPTPVGQYITSIDRGAGTFTVNAIGDTGFGTAGDYIFQMGDRPPTVLTSTFGNSKIVGVGAWNPVTTPSGGESFFGVDRTADVTRLSGQRLDISGMQPEEGYVTALARLAREGADPSHIFTSFTDDKNLKLALGSRVETKYDTVGDVGFESMRIRGPLGQVKVYPDINAPVGYARILTLDTWAFKYLGDLVNTADLDGSRLAREYQADRFEGRLSVYGNTVCYAPHKNMVATLPT